MLSLILLVFALVLFLLAAFLQNLPSDRRGRLACFGLAVCLVSWLLGGFGSLHGLRW